MTCLRTASPRCSESRSTFRSARVGWRWEPGKASGSASIGIMPRAEVSCAQSLARQPDHTNPPKRERASERASEQASKETDRQTGTPTHDYHHGLLSLRRARLPQVLRRAGAVGRPCVVPRVQLALLHAVAPRLARQGARVRGGAHRGQRASVGRAEVRAQGDLHEDVPGGPPARGGGRALAGGLRGPGGPRQLRRLPLAHLHRGARALRQRRRALGHHGRHGHRPPARPPLRLAAPQGEVRAPVPHGRAVHLPRHLRALRRERRRQHPHHRYQGRLGRLLRRQRREEVDHQRRLRRLLHRGLPHGRARHWRHLAPPPRAHHARHRVHPDGLHGRLALRHHLHHLRQRQGPQGKPHRRGERWIHVHHVQLQLRAVGHHCAGDQAGARVPGGGLQVREQEADLWEEAGGARHDQVEAGRDGQAGGVHARAPRVPHLPAQHDPKGGALHPPRPDHGHFPAQGAGHQDL
mmetsp:Transcript_15025/g.38105  ORF Transcript_15025/g.38105 Transcript_15025/m.38105 type:complete len:466 (+) Transcript_15025:325-1722(+)